MNIAIFASGAGSNAQKIIEYFERDPQHKVVLVVSNKKDAGVLDIAAAHQIPTLIIDRRGFYDTDDILTVLEANQVGLIVLAGFLWLVPAYLVRAFPRRMLNIHPALLPAYGGKGMYGMHVHEAVRNSGDRQTGITIHYVNEHYDEGDIVFQASCLVDPTDTAVDIARKVLVLEHRHFPEVIQTVCGQLEKSQS
jgi:phosphoribosylglycinamide formyltransferase-1